MLINVVTFILLICVCLGSQLSNLIQQRLVPNGTALSSNLLAMNNSAEDIFKNFISEGAKKPEDVDKVIIVLKSLIGEQDGYVDGLDNKIKAELENWNKVKAASKAAIAKSDGELVEATKGNSKVKLDEGKKESAAKQAHTDAKANKNKLMPNINHQKEVLQQVIEWLKPLSTHRTIEHANKWEKCYANINYDCSKDFGDKDKHVCLGGRDYKPSITVRVLPGKTYTVTLDFFYMYSWDNEIGRVYVNEKLCWNRAHRTTRTNKNCGPWSRGYAQKFSVTCANAVGNNNGEIKIRVWTNINEGISNEYLGVANLKTTLKG